jgi:hypothetical protein
MLTALPESNMPEIWLEEVQAALCSIWVRFA